MITLRPDRSGWNRKWSATPDEEAEGFRAIAAKLSALRADAEPADLESVVRRYRGPPLARSGCDVPHAHRLTIGVLAAVAEHERDMISQRTKAALFASATNNDTWA